MKGYQGTPNSIRPLGLVDSIYEINARLRKITHELDCLDVAVNGSPAETSGKDAAPAQSLRDKVEELLPILSEIENQVQRLGAGIGASQPSVTVSKMNSTHPYRPYNDSDAKATVFGF